VSGTATETVTAFIRLLEAGDVDGAVLLVTDDCEYDNVPMSKVVGPEAIAALLRPMLSSCAEVEWVVHRQVADGPLVFNERLDRFLLPSGWVEVPVCGVWEVADGRIRLWRDYFDLATFRSQLSG
jgi:limonene-1,2-epoxide hydrolase